MSLEKGAPLIAAIIIGQNRWMFLTNIIEHVEQKSNYGRTTAALRLLLPEKVERCSRRNFYRISTVILNLPKVRCWPLIDPVSALVAEQANREHVRSMLAALDGNRDQAEQNSEAAEQFIEQLSLPEVGPPFDAALANIGGGGIGIVVDPDSARHFGSSRRVFWMQFALPPEIPVPIAVTAKLVHTHIDSSQHTYAGLAFDFSRSRDHERFITEQLSRYVEMRQHALRRRRAA
jgi:c-di-GMP-binding flagellar brake protein YcgR